MMYYPANAGYDPNAQWQAPPPPPQGGLPPPPPPLQAAMSAEAAAAYKNYGYGNVAPPRSGAHGSRGGRNGGLGRGQPQANPTGGPNAPYAPGQPMVQPGQQSLAHQPPGAPYPPAKRAKYDSTSAGYLPPPHAATPPYQGQQYQPVQYQAPPPSGQPLPQPMSMGQAYYPPPQSGHSAYPPHSGLPQHPYQYQTQMHQPIAPGHHQPQQPYQMHDPHASASPLAVALMKATPMASGSRGGEKHRPNPPPQYNANLPPPPPSSYAPPPPPPSEPTLPSGPKGLASLPERPMSGSVPTNPGNSASSVPSIPSTPDIPTGPKASIKRDTRPLPSQSRHVEANLQGSKGSGKGGGPVGGRGKGPPTGPARGGRGGGRGGGGRPGFDGPRGPNRQPNQHQQQQQRRDDRFDQSQQNKEKGYKRTFSQTGPPAHSPRGPATRPRTNSNATATSTSIPTGPKKGQAANAKKREKTMEGSPAPQSANSKSLKRTLTDFRIDSLEIPMLNWVWKATPLSQILAQMNLKEKEDVGVKKEEDAETDETEKPPPVGSVDRSEAQPVSDEQSAADAGSIPAETLAPASTELQRSDSRPEKRKHARDEDEEEEEERLRQAASEEAKDPVTYPVGKKVKSEKIPETVTESSVPANEPPPLVRNNAAIETSEENAEAEGAIISGTIAPTIAEDASSTNGAKNEQQDDASETSDSSDEVADSIIASRPHEDKHETRASATPIPDGSDSVPDTGIKVKEVQNGHEQSKPVEDSRSAKRAPLKSVPKKFWENSRLRIYFMSPVELEQKDVRQTLLKKKVKPIKTPVAPMSKEETREGPTETVTSKGAAPPADVKQAESSTTEVKPDSLESDVKPEASDDLDGEPLSAEAEAASNIVGTAAAGDIPSEKECLLASEPIEEPEVANVAEESQEQELQKDDEQDARGQLSTPSADRLSIAYAQNTRRLVIDAEVIDEIVLHRAEGKIEINLRMETPSSEEEGAGFRCAKGVYVEKSVSSGDQGYEEIGIDELSRSWEADESGQPAGTSDEDGTASDHLFPPLHHLLQAKKEGSSSDDIQGEVGIRRCTIIAKMDRAHPLTEAKWVRTGNPDDWIASVIGNTNSYGNNNNNGSNGTTRALAAQQLPKGEQGLEISPNSGGKMKNKKDDVKGFSAWKGKIRVVDPDAPPTFQHALEIWLSSANTKNGFDEARYRFVKTHFQDINNVLEVLLRLIRGSSSGASSSSSSSSSTPYDNNNTSQSTNLAAQSKALNAPYPEYQTPISLASFQLFKLSLDNLIVTPSLLSSSKSNVGSNNEDDVKKQQGHQVEITMKRKIGEIIRNLPYSLIFKSLDSMFLDFKRGNLGK